MANTFKLKTKADVSSAVPSLIYTVPNTATGCVVLGMILTNKATSEIRATVYLESNTSDVEINENIELLHSVKIPAYTTLEVFSGQKLNLQTDDLIRVQADTPGSLDFALSLMEMT